MSKGWMLGGVWHDFVETLGTGTNCTWQLVRRAGNGDVLLLQMWTPKPVDHELDKLRENYLLKFQNAERSDPLRTGFGYNKHCAYFLQVLEGQPLSECWKQWGPQSQKAFLSAFKKTYGQTRQGRFLEPRAIMLRPGQIDIPRVMGTEPFDVEDLTVFLEEYKSSETDAMSRIWEYVPDLALVSPLPIRGRVGEMTYLKSLVMGFATPHPAEYRVVLGGEDGLGHHAMASWARAVAETEGLWVTHLHVEPLAQSGPVMAHLLGQLLCGFEADFYAQYPETARILARRLSSFAFLRAGRKQGTEVARVEAEEVDAALQVLAFCQAINPRVVVIENLERGGDDLQDLLASLALRSQLPFVFTHVATEQQHLPHALLARFKDDQDIALMALGRMEDVDLKAVLGDILGASRLSDDFERELIKASLGNPGLLRTLLEAAYLDGDLLFENGIWKLAEARSAVRLHEDLLERILKGRLGKLDEIGMTVLRTLAIMERPLDQDVLAHVLGLAGDPLDEVLKMVLSSRLVQGQGGRLALSEMSIRELILRDCPQSELRRLAQLLLKGLQERGENCIGFLHLEALASDAPSAMAQILKTLEQEPPAPVEAESFVQQALQLNPSALQRALLWEYLAEAWRLATQGGRVSLDVLKDRSPYEFALESLGLARAALDEGPELGESVRDLRVRILRKEAELHTRVRDHASALRAIHGAASRLMNHPRHPEQARLRLVLGRVRQLEGFHNKGLKALEEGLELLEGDASASGQRDRLDLLLELGRILGEKAQFQEARNTLLSAQRILESHQDLGHLSDVFCTLARLTFHAGQPDLAYSHLRDGIHTARLLDDGERLAEGHLLLANFRSEEQNMEPALRHLALAHGYFSNLGDRVGVARVRAARARAFAIVGERVDAENELLLALGTPPDRLTAVERGEFAFFQAEVSAFMGPSQDSERLYSIAAEIFEGAGLIWRELLARLRGIQVSGAAWGPEGPDCERSGPWIHLEALKPRVEATRSRWLEVEWKRAHARLLSGMHPDSVDTASEALSAWSEVQSGARELRFPALALEASTQSAALLLSQNEKLGARSRLQDAYATFQDLWNRIPEAHGMAFLGRPDIHRFRLAVESAGLSFVLPERVDPLAEWTPTQASLPMVPISNELP